MLKNKKLKKALNIFLFYLHIFFWFLGALAVFFLPLHLVVVGVVIYFLHLVVFKGCIINKWQKQTGGFIMGKSFYDVLYKIFTGRNLNKNQSLMASKFSQVAHLTVVFARFLLNYPINFS